MNAESETPNAAMDPRPKHRARTARPPVHLTPASDEKSGGSMYQPAVSKVTVPSPDAIATVPIEGLPSLVLALAAAQAAVAARLVDATPRRDDTYLSVDEVAAELKLDPAWVYRQAARWSFAVKLSPKVVRIERAGLRRWLAQRRRRSA